MTFDEFMTSKDVMYLRITKKCYHCNKGTFEDYTCTQDIDEYFKFKLDNSIAYIRNYKLIEHLGGGIISMPGQIMSNIKIVDCIGVDFNRSKIDDGANDKPNKLDIIVKLLDNNTLAMDSVHCIFRYESYANYALEHNYNIKFTQTTSTDSVKIIKYFNDRGFGVEFGVDKELTPDRVCTIETIYVMFINPKQVKSND